MSNTNLKLTKSIGRVDASDMGIYVSLTYALKGADNKFFGRIDVTVQMEEQEESSVNTIRALASQKADDLLSQIVSLLPSSP